MKVRYINRRCLATGDIETVEEMDYETRKDRRNVREAVKEYNIQDKEGVYNISQRCTRAWKNK